MTSGGWPPSSCYGTGGTSLLELNGDDLRREPIEVRKATLASILRKSRPGVRLNQHLEFDSGPVVFQHACKMGLEGIVSKRLGSRYRSWLKFKNPEAPGGEARGGRGLGSLIITRGLGRSACNAASQRRSGSFSPAFASSIIFWATASRVGLTGPSVRSSATRAISKAMPMRRVVSGSNLWPSR